MRGLKDSAPKGGLSLFLSSLAQGFETQAGVVDMFVRRPNLIQHAICVVGKGKSSDKAIFSPSKF